MVDNQINSLDELGNQDSNDNKIKKIVGINFLIFLVYYVTAFILLKMDSEVSFFYIYLYPLQALINFIIAGVNLSRKEYKSASAYFLSAILLLIVGFGACFVAVIGVGF